MLWRPDPIAELGLSEVTGSPPEPTFHATITLAKFDGFAHNAPVRKSVRVV